MKLEQAIKQARRIECLIHVQDGVSYPARISKKDALAACDRYLNDVSTEERTGLGTTDAWLSWENEIGSIIAMQCQDNTLSIGR